jgi:hypothetical protein
MKNIINGVFSLGDSFSGSEINRKRVNITFLKCGFS